MGRGAARLGRPHRGVRHGPLIAAGIGMILMGLLRTPLRWTGAAGAGGSSIVWALKVRQPDILISAEGHHVGVRGRDGRLHVMRTGKDTFLMMEWLAADADARAAGGCLAGDGVSCDDAGCVVGLAGRRSGRAVAAARTRLADDCERAMLIVTARQAPGISGASVIDPARLRPQGALAMRRTAQRVRRGHRQATRLRPAVVAGGGKRGGDVDARRWVGTASPRARRRDTIGSRSAGGGMKSLAGLSAYSNAPR